MAGDVHRRMGSRHVIVEGTDEWSMPSMGGCASACRGVKATSKAFAVGCLTYVEGVWRLKPVKVLAWTTHVHHATRFRF